MYSYAHLGEPVSGYRQIVRIIHSENMIDGEGYVLINDVKNVSASDLYEMSSGDFISKQKAPDLRTPEQVSADLISKEESWITSEMSVADIEINKHLDGDARAIATEAKWRTYRCQLRDYVKGGQIVGERPVRPV